MFKKLTVGLMLAAFSLSCLISCGGGGGGGGGAKSPEEATTASLADIDADFLKGTISDAVFATRLDEALAAVDGREDGPLKLQEYLLTGVVGESALAKSGGALARGTAKTPQETIASIRASDAYLRVKIFVVSVASNLLIADPVNTLLEFAQPEIFLSIASVIIRSEIYAELVDGTITALQAEQLYELGRKNPWAARKALTALLAQPAEPYVDAIAAAGPLRNPPAPPPPNGDTKTYSGPFSISRNESFMGCTWHDSITGDIVVTVSGVGSAADPFEGTFELSGNIVTTLVSGVDCQGGDVYTLSGFEGTAFGNDGKLWAEGDGTVTLVGGGSGPFYAAITNGVVSASSVTGAFEINIMDEPIYSSVTLAKE